MLRPGGHFGERYLRDQILLVNMARDVIGGYPESIKGQLHG